MAYILQTKSKTPLSYLYMGKDLIFYLDNQIFKFFYPFGYYMTKSHNFKI